MDPVADRDEIIRFCDELLDAGGFEDYGPNGMQVPGGRSVGRIATAVSAHLASIEAAVSAGAQMLLTHHGLFWSFHPASLTEQMARRLRIALDAGLTVAGYHLPLDAHPEIGNNALLCRILGFEPGPAGRPDPGSFGVVKGRAIGAIGRRSDPVPAGELFDAVEKALSRRPLVFDSGPERIETVGVVTGAASSELGAAVGLGLDAFITGEPAEHAMADAVEGGIHFIAAGHYATETLGIRCLGDLIAKRFGVEHEFIDLPNPI